MGHEYKYLIQTKEGHWLWRNDPCGRYLNEGIVAIAPHIKGWWLEVVYTSLESVDIWNGSYRNLFIVPHDCQV